METFKRVWPHIWFVAIVIAALVANVYQVVRNG